VTETEPLLYRVLEILTGAGYRTATATEELDALKGQFPATLVGGEQSIDLIVVTDTITDSSDRLTQKLAALARLLDIVGSRRSITCVLVGPVPPQRVLRRIGQSCRVLAVGSPVASLADRAIRDALAVLLPLQLPASLAELIDPLDLMPARIGGEVAGEVVDGLLGAASLGAGQVEAVMSQYLSEPFASRSGQES
jgi:hypothetical protein